MWHIGIRCVVGLIVSFFLNFVECNSVWTSEKGRNAEMFRYRTAISSQVSGCPQQDLGYRIMNHKLDMHQCYLVAVQKANVTLG